MKTKAAVLTVISGHHKVSLQDLGRQHSLSFGVTQSGVADEYGFMTANTILENNANMPALEIILGDVKFRSNMACTIAIFGVSIEVEVNNVSVNGQYPINLSAGDHLSILPFKKGV